MVKQTTLTCPCLSLFRIRVLENLYWLMFACRNPWCPCSRYLCWSKEIGRDPLQLWSSFFVSNLLGTLPQHVHEWQISPEFDVEVNDRWWSPKNLEDENSLPFVPRYFRCQESRHFRGIFSHECPVFRMSVRSAFWFLTSLRVCSCVFLFFPVFFSDLLLRCFLIPVSRFNFCNDSSLLTFIAFVYQ